jgi:hypothetical protein
MKSFRTILSEVAEPRVDDEKNFKDKHIVVKKKHPVAPNHVFTGKIGKAPKRLADYDKGEDELVYEGSFDVPTAEGGEYDEEESHKKYKKGNKSKDLRRESKMDPVGQEDDDIDNDGDVDSSDKYLHRRRRAIGKAMKKEEVELDESAHGKYTFITGPRMKGMGEGKPSHVVSKKSKMSKIGIPHHDDPGEYGHTVRVMVKNNETGEISHHHVYQSDTDRGSDKAIVSTRDVGTPRANQRKHEKALHNYLSGKKFSSFKEEVENLDEISRDLARRIAIKRAMKKEAYSDAHRNKMAKTYKGKNPHHINAMSSSGGVMSIVTNNGNKYTVTAKETGGKMPKTGDHINKWKPGAVNEEVENLDELSPNTLKSYAVKSYNQANTLAKQSLSDQPKSVQKASTAAFKRRSAGIKATARRLGSDEMKKIHKDVVGESVEQIDELSKKTLSSYTRKAASSMGTAAHDLGQKKAAADEVDRMTNRNMPNKYAVRDQMKKALGADHDAQSKDQNTIGKRLKGIDKATARLAKEESELEEKLVGGQKKLDHNKNGKIDAHDFHLMRKKKKMQQEEAEQLDELSPNTLRSYAEGDMRMMSRMGGMYREEVGLDEAEYTHHVARVGTTTWGVGKTPDEARKDAHRAIHKYYASSAPSRNDKEIDRHMARAEKTKSTLKIHPTTEKTYRKYATEEVELDELKQPSLMQKSKYWLAHGKTPKETARTEKRYAASKSSDTLERLKIGRSSDNVYKPGEKPKDDKSVKFGSPAHMQLKAIDRELKKRQANEEVELDEVTDQERLSARKIQRDAQTARHGIARKPGESMVAYLNRAKKHKEKMQKEEVELDESITKMSHGRLEFHLNTNTPHGSYTNDEMKAERDRRLKAGEGQAYKAAKTGLSEVTQSAVKKTVTFTGSDGKSHTRNVPLKRIDRDEHGQEKIRESVELDEAFNVGMLKLNDGGSVILKKEDVDVLNSLFKSLSSTNRKKMESTAMKDKNGFNEILSFAREAM